MSNTAMYISHMEQLPQAFNYLIERVLSLESVIDNLTRKPGEKAQEEDIITREEAAELLNISIPTLRTYTNSGIVPGNRLGRRVLYKRSDVINALTKIASA